MPMPMRALALPFSLLLASASACSGDDAPAAPEVVRLDDASDEVVLTLQDLLDRGEVTTDDEVAAQLVEPADGDVLPANTRPTFTWSLRDSKLRHGRTTGEFVWLHVEGPGMDAAIDVAAIETTNWEVDDEHWDLLRESTGPCQVQLISAYVDRGIVEEAFQPSTAPTFSVTE